jgi:hypothetical protein
MYNNEDNIFADVQHIIMCADGGKDPKSDTNHINI